MVFIVRWFLEDEPEYEVVVVADNEEEAVKMASGYDFLKCAIKEQGLTDPEVEKVDKTGVVLVSCPMQGV